MPHLSATVNKADPNMGEQIGYVPAFTSGHMCRSGIAGSHGNSRFNSLRHRNTIFHGGCAVFIFSLAMHEDGRFSFHAVV